MRFFPGSFVFGVVSVVYSLGAAAQTVTLPVTQDTWISGLGSTTVHGGELRKGSAKSTKDVTAARLI